jgi:glutamate formiminotransferase / formiminotetrahydrofolate cyclodeaminase
MKLIECVPNFSEGRDLQKIKAITDAIESVKGARLLDVDPGADTNRTVVTFVADPEAVVEAAFLAIKKAAELIDMRQHSGAHARMGATDVCPFIPVAGVTVEECIALAEKLAERVADELSIPVYLYEDAAREEKRRNLATIRQGEYEGLSDKLKDPDWKPDFGEAVFNTKSGATVIGVREFLIAYNVNLNTRDRKLAHDIALTIREQGRLKRDATGAVIKDEAGNKLREPGLLKNCKAVGWYIDSYQCAQVSINLTNFNVTNVHHAFEAVSAEAQKRGLRVTGSELVGLIPLKAIKEAGAFYLERQGKSPGVPDEELLRIAVQSLGLAELSPFKPEEKIIDYMVAPKDAAPLVKMTLREFANELSVDSPAPGGGSVSAVSGALAAGLASMVAHLTIGKKGYESQQETMLKLPVKAQALKDALLKLIDDDTAAFNQVMAAMKLPKKSDEQKAARAEALELATQQAIRVPLTVAELSLEAMKLCEIVARDGNKNSLSDAGVGALQALAALEGAIMNVLINLPGVTDEIFKTETKNKADELLSKGRALKEKITADVWKTLNQ